MNGHIGIKVPDTLAALKSNFEGLFPGSSAIPLPLNESLALWTSLQVLGQPAPKAAIRDEKSMVAFVYLGQEKPQGALHINLGRKVRNSEEQFARSLTRVFNEDLRHVTNLNPFDEHWGALEQTRSRRAMARFINFRPHKMSNWIKAMESSMALTYEGRNVRHCLVLARNLGRLKKLCGSRLVPMKTGMPLDQALLSEKWIRAVVDGSRVALVAGMHSGQIGAFLSLSEMNPDDAEHRYAPHWNLVPVQAVLTSSSHDVALVASPHGDLFILTGKGIVFQKSQGKWQLLEYEGLHELLAVRFKEEVVISILRAVLDLSFERTGALFCVIDSHQSLRELVPDHGQPQSANASLRASLKGKDIRVWTQRQIITAAAAMDGGIVFDKNGKVLDVACMFATPREISKRGLTHPGLLGARSQAAWRASFMGVAIKISEDGPITVYERGQVIGQLG